MKPLIAFLALSFVASFPVCSADEYQARTYQAPDGATLLYRLLTPRNYDAAKKYPLVLFLHGAGERGADNAAQLKYGTGLFLEPAVRDKYPCFVVAPQCPPEQKWSDIDWKNGGPLPPEPSAPAKQTLAVLEGLTKEFSIDPERLYVTGLSMGGYGSWDIICRSPDRWAAAVPICGGGDKSSVARVKGMAVWAFHGDADKAVPVERTREMIATLRAAGGHPLYSEYPGVEHDSWTTAYQEPELLPWLFAQHRGHVVAFDQVASPNAQPPSSEFPGGGPVQPGIWFRALWKGKRDEWVAAKGKDQGAVIFLGDSITQGWGTLAHDFPNIKVANRGMSGDTSRGLRYRLKGDVVDVKPKAVVLLIGTNDLGLGAPPELVAENVKALLDELRASNAKLPVIVCKVMPSDASKQRPAEKIARLNALIDEAIQGDPLFIRAETYRIFANEQGNATKEEFPDLLHPNAAGYAKWKAALDPIFAKLKLQD